MATLVKKGNNYYSKITIRVGKNSLNKRKEVLIKVDTDKLKDARIRNKIVTTRENEIRKDIRIGEATKSDLLNINTNTDWEWVTHTRTSMKIHTITEYVDKFLKYKRIKQMRQSTLDSYRYGLNKFIESIGSGHLVSDINQDDIDAFVEDLHMQDLTLSSIDSYLKSASTFLNWCAKRKYIEEVPMIELFRPVLEDKWLTESEYNQILGYEYTDDRFPKLFKLYGETGLRMSEVFYGVLTEDNNGIWLAIPNDASKSRKGRTITLNEEQRDTVKLVQSLWIERGCTIAHIRYYSQTFRKARKSLMIPSNKSLHSLRHYYGKTQVTITGNIYMVSGLMGHSSIKVTEDYYVKGFDRKSTLRDFPSLKEYLITPKNEQNMGEYVSNSMSNTNQLPN